MIFDETGCSPAPSRDAIRAAHGWDEATAIAAALAAVEIEPAQQARIDASARDLVERVRAAPVQGLGLEAFLQEYSLSSAEGIALLNLAEALLRVPDAASAELLIRDKLGGADWRVHRGRSPSPLVNAVTAVLTLTGRVLRPGDGMSDQILARAGAPVIRHAALVAMRVLGSQFVMGRTIEAALARARKAGPGYRHSFDMLGEAARTTADAERYTRRYAEAIAVLGGASNETDIARRPGISVKLSALHPRYEEAQRGRVWAELQPRLRGLALAARAGGLGFTIDAEEAERLELSLDIVDALSADSELAGWDGFGLAVQAYQARALAVVDHLVAMAGQHRRRLTVRLVKGAYWDSEIKRAQERGLPRYPVFTRKAATDVNYLACATRLLAAGPAIYPAFATHNAQTLAAIRELAVDRNDWEFQRLHGMGEALHEAAIGDGGGRIACRVYAPVGGYEDLLAYLVRRLLENGANTSFIHRISDPATPVDRLIADPVARLRRLGVPSESGGSGDIPLPPYLYGAARRNSLGTDLAHRPDLESLGGQIAAAIATPQHAYPLTGDTRPARPGTVVRSPGDQSRVLGNVVKADGPDVAIALERATRAFPIWERTPVAHRARCLREAARLLEERRAAFAALIIAEGGRTLANALDEVREAVDFCRYYAAVAERDFAAPLELGGPAGEANTYGLAGRGVFACISPWNFPLAIFLGQVTAALVAGNAVVAKPAEQTPLVAFAAVRLLYEAGVPVHALHLLPGDGAIGAALVADPRVVGVAFTGSFAVAQAINRSLAARGGPIVPLIAETGGVNVMIADATALPEQVTADVLRSAFDSAGQRCSALRILYLQDEIADRVLPMITGAMAELVLGDPLDYATDIGPVIDRDARDRLESYLAAMRAAGRVHAVLAPPERLPQGFYVAPAVIGVEGIEAVPDEIFGPFLHVARWRTGALDRIVDAVNASGYGLTLGIHSRIEARIDQIASRARVGNIYVNRNMIGAVVGIQPFGGEGLSGTGPKAGGPRYLARFAAERTLSVNTAAAGGAIGLLARDDQEGE
jgi:RHH-type proline utilization regulon transcriptional repressor/proline dehydrogenase/delta 1-pyrroline-5-carboxylate dehydrogenase